mmetsp:Transcript_21896/g.52100  ORF Transcript_21896/g.52100 Transcript_21896/m.52100 type:complete len:448 (+) Transcript_21896:214-1557(+)|eukprot:CAMPEP_0197181312 /NCGR_PEP_ID=MMETSP1423-20130617/5638_1 /TAXON_ID=476441 /ORGANISM="Pseudo-nitzschia heimii, Strain UNC1101" /LENGTH=447 /DNA_ID=CAMNT_0042631545 /DNA_START=139 /DNA_END=1482 /DNA_ORIENTATION=+
MRALMSSWSWTICILVVTPKTSNAFIAPLHGHHRKFCVRVFPEPRAIRPEISLAAQSSEEEEEKENPYQDPSYPELEFVDYSDPEYQVDMGTGDEFFDSDVTEERVEAMREERRVKNDEFQFETYYRDVLKEGREFKGEWTVYRTSTFLDGDNDANGRPRLSKAVGPFKVISRGERINIGDEEQKLSDNRLEYERILHHEKVFNDPDESEAKSLEIIKQEELSMKTKFWPEQLSSFDFRGQQGIMCVGNAYTICNSTPLVDSETPHVGPYGTYSAELGITSEDDVRFRIKLDYSVLEDDIKKQPPLHLKSFTICRETLGMWPRAQNYKSAIEAITQDALFGPRGAGGGLYDPPPVGSAEQASQYLLLDLEGRATVLLPYLMDQDPDVHDSGWVTTLDWTPSSQRYQVDRKTKLGKQILGLRTLELTEVQSADAETYRPTDGGENMRQ